jgi:hypothetical protein
MHLLPQMAERQNLGRYATTSAEISGKLLEVHLFAMEPTPHWWQDIVSAREEGNILKKRPNLTAEDLHLNAVIRCSPRPW